MPDELYDEYGNPIIRVVSPKHEFYDEYGNPIVDIEQHRKALGVKAGPTQAEYREAAKGREATLPPSWLQKTTETLGDWTPIVGGLAGEAAGALAGGGNPLITGLGNVGGTALGSLAQQNAQIFAPQNFGYPNKPPDFADMGKQALMDGILNAILTPAQRAISRAPFPTGATRTAIAQKMAPSIKMFETEFPEAATFTKLHPELEPMVGQLAPGTPLGLLEGIVTPLKARAQVARQQNVFKNVWQNISSKFGQGTPEQLANNIREAGLKGEEAIGELENKSYSQLRLKAEKFNKLIRPADPGTIGPVKEISGPIYLDTASNPLDEFLKQLKIKDPDLKTVADIDRPLVKVLQDIGGLRYSDGSPVPISINEALELKHALGSKGSFGSLHVGGKEYGYQQLTNLVKEDIERSIAGTAGSKSLGIPARPSWKLGKSALSDFLEGNAWTEQKYKLFGKDSVGGIYRLLEDPVHTIHNLKILDPQELDRLMAGAAIGDPARKELVRKSLASNTLQSLFQSSYDTDKKQFIKDAPIKWFSDRDNQALIKRIFTHSERQDIEYLFKTIQHFDPKLPLAGLTALGIRGMGAVFTIVPGIATSAYSGDITQGTKVSGMILGALIGANAFSRAVLTNPKVARAAANLMRLPPMSQDAKIASGVLFSALKGAQVELMTPDGTKLGTGTVNQLGKVKPNFQFHEQQFPQQKEAIAYPAFP